MGKALSGELSCPSDMSCYVLLLLSDLQSLFLIKSSCERKKYLLVYIVITVVTQTYIVNC